VTVLIEDSPRNTFNWMIEAIQKGFAQGGVITPFATPVERGGYLKGLREASDRLRAAGGEAWFDPMTHALQMSGVGDFRYYDEHDLWRGERGELSTRDDRVDHVRRVFSIQTDIGANRLGPTVLLHHAETNTSQLALDLAREAVAQEPLCWLSIVGSSSFWASGVALDAHIGALAQLEPAGWFLTVARPLAAIPVAADPEEVSGLCRTSRALGEYAPVQISHGDLAALPAVAAGAAGVGTGWDVRQRVCAYANFTERDPNGGPGGGWYKRPTFRGLVGSLTENEAAVLASRNPNRTRRLGPPPPPGPKEAFLNHVEVLSTLVSGLTEEPDYELRYRRLVDIYDAAATEWPPVVQLTRSPLSAKNWIDPFADGLALYGSGEGW
jgi:hypothetical protein